MAKPKYDPGQRVMMAHKDKVPFERYYFVVGREKRIMHGKTEYVYHLAGYDFERLAFRTTSHVTEKLIKPCTTN